MGGGGCSAKQEKADFPKFGTPDFRHVEKKKKTLTEELTSLHTGPGAIIRGFVFFVASCLMAQEEKKKKQLQLQFNL